VVGCSPAVGWPVALNPLAQFCLAEVFGKANDAGSSTVPYFAPFGFSKGEKGPVGCLALLPKEPRFNAGAFGPPAPFSLTTTTAGPQRKEKSGS